MIVNHQSAFVCVHTENAQKLLSRVSAAVLTILL